jgi:hypothetical protein
MAMTAREMQGTALNLLKGSKGTHATLRLDGFMKGTDPLYAHSEDKAHGDAYVRRMAIHGHQRPSPAFTAEGRAHRMFMGKESALDMSNLPPTWNDPKSDPREGTLEYPEPPQVDTTFMAAYENHNLMLPSERFREHLSMKDGERKWREDRAAIWTHNKRKRMVERHHKQGVVGVDSPLHEGTKLYAGHRDRFEGQVSRSARHASERRDHLEFQMSASDAASFRNFGEPSNAHIRSSDIPLQRKHVDPDHHPFRFLDTHNRIFPDEVALWDKDRARTQRSHDVRHKDFDIITGLKNDIGFLNGPGGSLLNIPGNDAQ